MRVVLTSLLLGAISAGCVDGSNHDTDSDSNPDTRWPTYDDKDSLGDPDTAALHPINGAAVPRLRTLDQFGDPVDLYDFAGSEVPVVVQFVYPGDDGVSQDLGQLLSDGTGPLASGSLGPLPSAVANNELFYVRIISVKSLSTGGLATEADLTRWNEEFPRDDSPLLLDQDAEFFNYVQRYWVVENVDAVRPEILRIAPATMTVDREPSRHYGILEELFGN